MNDKTKELMRIDDTFVMHTYGRFPVVLEYGEGAYVYDTEGRKYLDMVGGIAVNMLGYGNKKLASAIGEQAARLMHTSNLFYTAPQSLLAEKLVKLSGLKKAFFCNSGAEANEAALKLARKAAKLTENPRKTRVISAYNSFHGRTMGAITATGQAKYQKNFAPLVPDFDYIEYNNLEQLENAVDKNTCAVIMEPVQGESGVHPAEKEFLAAVRRLCTENKAAMILDEVQTGMGRTGRMFAFERFGVKPDILTLAKMLGGGFPIGACLAGEGYQDVFAPGDHASTFGGNPLAATAALTTLKICEEEGLVENADKTGAYLRGLLKGAECVKEARGFGLMIGVEFEKPIAKKILAAGFEEGIILNAIGDSVIRLVPPLILTEAQAEEAAGKIGRCIKKALEND
ncbi:MAG: acetylornithine transaminase [Abditibacteriota bacterium]|nr:acetylornithine transaminase [Abditibacteriota bacterium]